MIKTDFVYRINDNESILVRAKASRVTPLEVYGLSVTFLDDDEDETEFYPDRVTMEDIEESAHEKLLEEKYEKELRF